MQNPLEFIQNINRPFEIIGYGSPDLYLDVMQISIDAYDFDDIQSQFCRPVHEFQNIFKGYSRIGMSRLVNVMAFLIKYERLDGLYDFWIKLLHIILWDILKDHKKSGVEFLVLELCTALIASSGFIKKSDYNKSIELLKKINPYFNYDSTIERKRPGELHNFCMYGICAEYLRGYLTGIDTEEFILRHWEVQKDRFDTEGRYMDPGCPMVYDITSRYRLALMLNMGYDGEAADKMREILLKGAPGLLLQMSSSYKFPYGGRSNQFNFNESLVASMCEFYANEFSKTGDVINAGIFKGYAIESIEKLQPWLETKPARHIKNQFPINSNFGIDSYGTYERYMGTMGAFLSLAVLAYDGNIKSTAYSGGISGFIYETSSNFHKLFASCGGYSLEFDNNADNKYDATGLGRIHYMGSPIELALSMPFAKYPKYLLSGFINRKGRALGAFWTHDGVREYLAESGFVTDTKLIRQSDEQLEFMLNYEVESRGIVTERYIVSGEGINISTYSDFADISYCVPVLKYNGREESGICLNSKNCYVAMAEWVYKIMWEDCCPAVFCEYLLYNRNGVYKELNINNSRKEINLKLSITRSGNEEISKKK